MSSPRDARRERARLSTGDETLDHALDGGLPMGSVALVEGEAGVGSTEFAHALLHVAARETKHTLAWLSASRGGARVRAEAQALFPRTAPAALHVADSGTEGAALLELLETLDVDAESKTVVVFEPLSALASPSRAWVRRVGDLAAQREALVLLLHAPGALDAHEEARVREQVDIHLRFAWHAGTLQQKRLLFVPKLRGLASALEGAAIPLFEVEFRRGVGCVVSRVKNVV